MTAQEITANERQVSDAANQVMSDGASVVRAAKDAARQQLKEPTTAAAVTGAAVMGAFFVFGILETAVGGAAAYVTYRLLQKERSDEKSGAMAS